MLSLNVFRSDTARKLAVEVNNLLAFMDFAKPMVTENHLHPSMVALESELRSVDNGQFSREAEREGYQRVIEDLHDRLGAADEETRLWHLVAQTFCEAHDIDFDPEDPDAMLIAAGECRDQS